MARENKYKSLLKEAKTLTIMLSDIEALKKQKASVKDAVKYAYPIIFGKKAWESFNKKIYDEDSKKDFFDSFGYFFPKNEKQMLSALKFALFLTVDGNGENSLGSYLDYRAIEADIKKFIEKPDTHRPSVWKWSLDFEDRFFGSAYKYADDDSDIKCYKKTLDSCCKKNEASALYARAYAAYGGNEVYPCDWYLAETYMLKLMESADIPDVEKGFIANSLGYIYYYGRASEDGPDYDSALKYFTIGMCCGVSESVYKIGDMNLYGYGVPKNIYAAFMLYSRIFHDSREAFLRGDNTTKLADAALRMGIMCENGYYMEKDYDMAYYFYTMADFAIRMRRDEDEYYGDEVVAERIEKAVENVRKYIKNDDPEMSTYYSPFPEHTIMLLEGGAVIEVRWEELKDGVRLKSRRVSSGNGENTERILVVHPEAHYCKLLDEVVEDAVGIKAFRVKGNMKSFMANTVSFNKNHNRFEFHYNGEMTACIDADSFNYKMR